MKKTARKILRFLSADLKLKGRSRLVRKLGPYLQEDNPIRTRMSDGSYMSLDLTEQWSSAMYYGLYDVVERDLIITLLQRGDTFFDLGAHVGYYTIAAAKKVAETGAVHAFEPNSRNANVLEQNVKLNAFENVRINRVAVSDARGHARLAVPDMASYGPGVSAWATIMDYFPGAICEPVETISIDEYIEYAHIQCINLIKMDIEAAEVLALRGMCRVFGGQTPPRILSEVNSKRLKESGYDTGIIHSILSKFGYTGYRVVGQGLEKADAPSVDRVVENSLFFPPADPCLAILGETVSLRSLINLMRSGRK